MTSENFKITCGGCGETYETRIRGNTSRHACGHEQYVWKNPALKDAPAQTLDCAACGHKWETRAKAGNVTRCPSCKHARRVPTPPAAPEPVPVVSVPPPAVSAPAPALVRPVPVDVRPPTEPVRPPAMPAPIVSAPARPAPVTLPATGRPALPPADSSGWLGQVANMLARISSPAGTVWPAGWLPDASVLDRAAGGVESRPPRPTAPLPIDPAAVDRALASFMLTREPDWPAGSCPLGSCGELVTTRLDFGPTARLDVCDRHAARVAAAAVRLDRTAPIASAIFTRP